MRHIENWFSKQQHRQNKFVSLYDMLFDGCEKSYLSFRLSLFNLQTLFHFFTHMVMFYFMSQKLASKTFTTLILVSAVKMLVSAGWWGGLEILRTQVRYAYHKGEKDVVNQVIGFWLVIALFFALPVAGVATYYGFSAYMAYIHRDPIIEYLFISALFFSLAIQIPLGAFHSGIYGISRVMRPRISMVLSYLIGLCVLALAWPQFKQYAILMSVIGESATSLILTYYYTSHMYWLYKITPAKPTHKEFRTMLMQVPVINFFLGSLANVLILGDALLIVGFYFLALGNIKELLYVKMTYLAAPLIRASSDWARLFYFDRKQLENDQLTLFISNYEKGVSRVASILGFSFGVFATVACYLLISPAAGQNMAVMIPFFLMRSLIANYQVRAYTYHYYYDVIVSGFLSMWALISAYTFKTTLPEKAVFIALSMIVVNAFLKRYRLPCCSSSSFQHLYTNLYDWLSKLSRREGTLEICTLTLDSHATIQEKLKIIRLLAEKLQIPGDQICVFANYPILFFKELRACAESPSSCEIAAIGGGIISGIEKNILQRPPKAPYPEHYFNIRQCPIIHRLVGSSLDKFLGLPHFSTDEVKVVEYFFNRFPTGIYYNPDRHLGPDAQSLNFETVRKFNTLIWQYLYQQRSARRSDVDLSLLFDGGVVRVIFVIPFQPATEEHYKNIREWHDFLHAVNLADSLRLPSPPSSVAVYTTASVLSV